MIKGQHHTVEARLKITAAGFARSRKLFCKRGHPRNPDNLSNHNSCRTCDRMFSRGWRLFNPEKHRVQIRNWEEKHPGFRSFSSAKSRCTNKKDKNWPYYGGRGIQFRFTDYNQFISCVGQRPTPNHSLDRINVNGHYEPGNVRWATKREQLINTTLHSLENRSTEELKAELRRRGEL